MKTFSGSVRIVWHQLTHQKGLYLALILGVAMFATGCGKKESAAPSATTAAPQPAATQETAAAAAPSQPAYVPPPPAATTVADKGIPVLQQLNRSVIGYRIQNHRNPTSVEEVAAFAGVQVPSPPPGKKYVFNNRGLIVLVDNSTK
jgi:hypothetical protein